MTYLLFGGDCQGTETSDSPSVMDLEHFMESFLALRSNQEPRLLPMGLLFGLLLFTLLGPTWPTTPERLEKVLDFCSIFMSILPSGCTKRTIRS